MRRWDRCALEGMPLKLMMVALLTSLTAPVVMGSMEDYERAVSRSEMMAEADRLGYLIEDVRSAGEGNRRFISLSIPMACERHSLSMEIGGEVSASSSLSIRCLCQGEVFYVVLLDDPPARTTTFVNGTLRIGAGSHDLVLECVLVGDKPIVIVRPVG